MNTSHRDGVIPSLHRHLLPALTFFLKVVLCLIVLYAAFTLLAWSINPDSWDYLNALIWVGIYAVFCS
ncbi:hypothetical protein [Martelella endophytica]|uniref:Uncharacterized protein n=1 Tax=Martelella endophytica TaxID=1486262 RepID=A0A0D5LKL4_MAREN|nr:hypothetical protein [Martelella endophytica]AJY44480.1 hypothetical protein TM49_00360 [Martelella endophytica]